MSNQQNNKTEDLQLCKEFLINVSAYRVITRNDVEYNNALKNAKKLLDDMNNGNLDEKFIENEIIKGFLNKWRCRLEKAKSGEISGEIKDFLEKDEIKNYLNKLKKYSLEDLAEIPEVKEIYPKIKAVIGPTCASKFLHILLPKLFVMWDGKIRKEYKENYNKEIKDNGKGYYKYLVKMNEIREILESECSKIGIQPNVEKYLNDKFGFDYTIAKYLDEYNWVKYNFTGIEDLLAKIFPVIKIIFEKEY